MMMSGKMAAAALLKVKFFWNKGYYAIYSFYDVTNKILLHDSNWGVQNWGTQLRDSTLRDSTYEGWSWFKFNNLGLALGTSLKFYTSVAKGLKLKVEKFLGLIPMFVEVTEEKLVGGGFWLLSPILNRVTP